jgi:peptidoglycan L-alanyl-D-glutamate endopeptidase CwlK
MLSRLSEQRLESCHIDLQRVVKLAAERTKLAVTCGYRNEVDQRAAYANGFSKAQYPNSPHNQKPSRAADLVPLPVDYSDLAAFDRLAVVVKQAAADLGIRIVWGGDFRSFKDRPHYELAPDA